MYVSEQMIQWNFYIAEPCAAPSGLLQLIWKITTGLAFCVTAEFQSGMNALLHCREALWEWQGGPNPTSQPNFLSTRDFNTLGFQQNPSGSVHVHTCAFGYRLLGMRPHSEANILSKQVQCVESGICRAADTES